MLPDAPGTTPTGQPEIAGVGQVLVSPPGAPPLDPTVRDPREWAAVLAVALVQTLHGLRPVSQLERWLDPEVLAAVGFTARRRARADLRPPTPGRGGARSARQESGRSAPQANVRGAPLPSVRSVRVQCPAPAVAEVAVHLLLGRRSLAMALRLQAYGDRWLCTALELGPREERTAWA
jgi:hypothetical protein